ncbi:MAG: gamma-glutamyltransferase [Candidatus Aminicenantia bacterium]
MKRVLLLIPLFIFSIFLFSQEGVVSSDSEIATKVGIEILRKGGNAVDAAVAVGFALAVTFPIAGNIGGGGFMLIRMSDGREEVIDYREMAPLKAHRYMYLDDKREVKKGLSEEGYLASGIPGTVAGLTLALKRYGTLPLKEVIRPAIELAEKGFPIDDYFKNSIESHMELLSKFPETKRILLNNGKGWKKGNILIQKDLANTLKEIAKNGSNAFYRGKIADLIEKDMKRNGGLIDKESLSSYKAILRKPIRTFYRGYEIVTAPPPSSGVIMLHILNILENFKISKTDWKSDEFIHIVAEAMKLSFRERARFLGDPDFVKIPLETLLSKDYALEKAKAIRYLKALSEKEADAFNPWGEKEETTHFIVIDKSGNIVSNTYTLNGSFGSGVIIKGTGILMNNEMDDFSIKPGYPNIYGLIGGEENCIQPGKRMLSSMTPTIVLKDGKPTFALGSPGGPTIINTVLLNILYKIDFGMSLKDAISAPRFHHQWIPNSLYLEEGKYDSAIIEALKNREHEIRFRKKIGDVHGIEIKNGKWTGVADHRGPGKAMSSDGH